MSARPAAGAATAPDFQKAGRILAGLAITVGITTVILTALRLFYGVDFNDEALYAAIPYRYALGARPFVDELFFQQISTVFVYPWVKLFYLITGGTTGLILYLRFVWLVFMASVGTVVWLATRRSLGWAAALLAALPCVAFIYFNIPALSYNTLGYGFLTAGLFSAIGLMASGNKKWLPAAGVLHGLAVVAYPTLAVAVAVFLIALLVSSRKTGWAARYLAGGLAVAVVAMVALLVAGPANIAASYKATSLIGVYGGGLAKLTAILKAWWLYYSGKRIVIVLILVCLLGKRVNPKAVSLVIALLPFAALSYVGYPMYLYSIGLITYLCLLGPFVYWLARSDRFAGLVFWFVWTPALFAGFATGLTSSNRYWAAGIGFFPGAVATLVLLWLAIRELRGPGDRQAWKLGAFALIIPLVALLWAQFAPRAYGDNSLADLPARVTSGGYAGIYTSVAKRIYMENLEKDLTETVHPGKTIMFYDAFPAGYLLTKARPYTDWSWMPPAELYKRTDRRATVQYYESRSRYPDYIVRLNIIIYTFLHKVSYPDNDPITRLASGGFYRLAVVREEYSIYEYTSRPGQRVQP